MHFPSKALWVLGMFALLIAGCGGEGTGGGAASQGGFTELHVNLTYANESIANLGTNIYQFTPNTTSVYTISLIAAQSDLSWALFDTPTFTSPRLVNCDAFMLAHKEECRTPVLASGITYYLVVDEWENVAGTYTLLIETPTFKSVAVATVYPSESIASFGDNFFQFTPNITSAHTISISAAQSDLSWVLYEDPAMALAALFHCDTFPFASNETCQTPVLTAGRTYYLLVSEWEGQAGSYNLLIDTLNFNIVTVGIPFPGESISSYGTRYYQFTPDFTSLHTISITAAQSDLSWALYDDPALSSPKLMNCDIFQVPGDEICYSPVLSDQTTYYLVVDEWDTVAGTFTLQIDPPNFRIVPVGSTNPGEVISPYGFNFYQFTAGADSTHTISLTVAESDLSWALYDDPTFSSAALFDCDTSFVPNDEICTTPPLTGGLPYYLMVNEWDVVAGTYSLRIDFP